MIPLDIDLLGKTPIVGMSTPYSVVQKRKVLREQFISTLYNSPRNTQMLSTQMMQSKQFEPLPTFKTNHKVIQQIKATPIKNATFSSMNSSTNSIQKSHTFEKIKVVKTKLNQIDNGMFKRYGKNQSLQIEDLVDLML
ncbi:Hypothetical_protein [Hexamita inflata]|uniref:Hypothetical_protein n=1 Tax=Hexamita inflata TaxID=28002 RepID=A0AA86V5M4_9EUKA|nr:Hypothetical protein HINF_LOCUS64817 [Hexamita inflata]